MRIRDRERGGDIKSEQKSERDRQKEREGETKLLE